MCGVYKTLLDPGYLNCKKEIRVPSGRFRDHVSRRYVLVGLVTASVGLIHYCISEEGTKSGPLQKARLLEPRRRILLRIVSQPLLSTAVNT